MTWQRVRDHVRARPLLADSLLAVALLLLGQLTRLAVPDMFWPASTPVLLSWTVLGMAAVAIRRVLPWGAVAVLSAQTVVTVSYGVSTEGIAILVLTYTVAAHLPLRRSALAAAVIWLPGIVAALVLERYQPPPVDPTVSSMALYLLFNTLSFLVAYLAGRIVFTRRRWVSALVERARTAEENQQAMAAQAVQDERRRIARELHDMVAHHVSVMGVLATGSRRMLRRDPAAADEALATIEETSRTVLREMRRLLDVLRTDPEPDNPLAPQPNLAGLDGLVEQVREAGLRVSMICTGETAAVAPGVALTVYRIAQEALTNVIKHGGPDATAEVRLDIGRQWLNLEVYDTGLGPQAFHRAGVGHGLVGMQERVALFGGTLRTGPRPGGGFRIFARLPVEDTTPDTTAPATRAAGPEERVSEASDMRGTNV